MTKSCKQVLSAPIDKAEYAWFTRYVFPSSVWVQRSRAGAFMFEELLRVTKGMSGKIDASMQSIFAHLQTHAEWHKVLAIHNETLVPRQDHDAVGLLRDSGIRDVAEAKQADEALPSFIDSNLAINVLTTTAKSLNAEFQSRTALVMSRYGEFRAGPLKSVERCQSKLENEYQDAVYPKAARLLDVVRCAVSFNTLEQLLAGYEGLRRHIRGSPESLCLARVKTASSTRRPRCTTSRSTWCSRQRRRNLRVRCP